MVLWPAVVWPGIVSSVADHWEEVSIRYLRTGEPVVLAYVETDSVGVCHGGTDGFRRGGDLVRCKPLTSARTVRWYIWEPLALDYSNDASCWRGEPKCAKPITYLAREIGEFRGRSELLPNELGPLLKEGTHRIFATPESLTVTLLKTNQRPPGIEIVVRKDDSYTGYLSELKGVPFVLLPLAAEAGTHQTDARLGADCVALVIYGQRRLGRDVPYVAPPALKKFLIPVPSRPDGTRQARQGDVLHFGFQTAVLYEDRKPYGVLNGDDLIIHTYHGRAEVVAFRELPYRHHEFLIYRWPQNQRTSKNSH